MWTKQVTDMIIAGVGETLYMTLFSTFFGYVFGMPLGILLKVSDKEGLRPNAVLYKICLLYTSDPERLWLRHRAVSVDRRPGLWRLPLFVSVHRRAVRDMLSLCLPVLRFPEAPGLLLLLRLFSSPGCTVGSRRFPVRFSA